MSCTLIQNPSTPSKHHQIIHFFWMKEALKKTIGGMGRWNSTLLRSIRILVNQSTRVVFHKWQHEIIPKWVSNSSDWSYPFHHIHTQNTTISLWYSLPFSYWILWWVELENSYVQLGYSFNLFKTTQLFKIFLKMEKEYKNGRLG